MRTTKHVFIRIMEKVSPEPNSGCWLWTGAICSGGYARIGADGWRTNRTLLVHRVLYELMRGPIPEGFEIDHLCRVRSCVNPDHLEPVTKIENLRRGTWLGSGGRSQSAKTHCPRGHAYSPENTYAHRGRRGCLECRRAQGKGSKAAA